eukprot:3819723-Prymnesium_polylepis.2
MGLLVTLASLQLVAMLWAASTHASDFWEGTVTTVCYALECAASICLISSATLYDSAGGDAEKEAQATSLAVASANLLLASAFVPVGLSLYDLLVCPIVGRVRKQEAGSWGEILCAVLWAMLLLPLGVVAALTGADTTFLDVAAEAEETITDTALVAVGEADVVVDTTSALDDSTSAILRVEAEAIEEGSELDVSTAQQAMTVGAVTSAASGAGQDGTDGLELFAKIKDLFSGSLACCAGRLAGGGWRPGHAGDAWLGGVVYCHGHHRHEQRAAPRQQAAAQRAGGGRVSAGGARRTRRGARRTRRAARRCFQACTRGGGMRASQDRERWAFGGARGTARRGEARCGTEGPRVGGH